VGASFDLEVKHNDRVGPCVHVCKKKHRGVAARRLRFTGNPEVIPGQKSGSGKLNGLIPIESRTTRGSACFRIEPTTREPESESRPVQEWLRATAKCIVGALIDACGLATLMSEGETESPEEVRSQRRRCLPNVDE
jgi:hypothetical protein